MKYQRRTGKVIAALLCLTFLVGFTPQPAQASGNFDDVSKDDWYAPAAEYVQEKGWMNGVENNRFAPQAPLDRATFAQILYNLAGQPELDSGVGTWGEFLGFNDVDPNSWYKTPTYWVYWKGLASGTGDGQFSPGQAVTREQMAQMLYRYAKATGNDVSFTQAAEKFSDYGKSSSWAREALNWAVSHNILAGDEKGNLNPDAFATRAEVAQLLKNAAPTLAKNKMWEYARPSKLSESIGIGEGEYPRVNGSTSTLELVQGAYEKMHGTWDESLYPAQALKTVPSYEKLIAGELDLILTPSPSQEVLDMAEAAGVELETHKIALEALVFITPEENPVENITGDQVRQIYLDYGIKSWNELGGPDKELVPLCRNSDSGSQSQLDNMILQGEPIHPDIYNNFLESTMPGMLRDTAYFHLSGNNGQPRDCYALGYTLYAYLQNHDDGDGVREDLKMLSYEGVSPTDETLLTGDYPLVDGYYAVLRKDTPKDSSTRKLLSWMLGEDFAQVMQGNGFFPVAKNKIR